MADHIHSEEPRRVVREVRHDVVHDDVPVAHDTGNSWTSYALVKYGFILVMTVIVLYFLARFIIPLMR